ncbi:MAG: hypothetical protein ABIF06_00325 [bacterium]
MKKTLSIILIVLIVGVLLLLGWFWLFPGSSAPTKEKISNLLPFGSGEDINITTNNGQQTINDEEGSLPTATKPTTNLFRITDSPVAGAIILNKSTSTVVRYVDRATGHITDVDLLTFEKVKISNKTLPKIYEAYFQSDGNTVLFRSLREGDVVENLSLKLTPPKTSTSTSTPPTTIYSVSATVLRGNLGDIVVGAGNSLFYSLTDSNSIVSSTFEGTNIKTLFSSAFTDWRLTVAGKSLVIYTKASSNVPGYAYILNASGGSLNKIVGPLNGLTVNPNPTGTRIAFSFVEDTSTKLYTEKLSDNTSYPLISTLAEKCIWSDKYESELLCGVPTTAVGRGEPDGWYSGLTHFSDRIWMFDVNTEVAEILVDPKKTYDLNLDVSNLILSPNEDYLVFTDRNTLSLWALKLEVE